jgi:glutathione S-transferase
VVQAFFTRSIIAARTFAKVARRTTRLIPARCGLMRVPGGAGSSAVTAENYKLYGRPGSGSDIPQILLEEIRAPYEFIRVGRQKADIEAYRRIAQTDKVPALTLPGGETIFESAAICIHLTERHPQARLAPAYGTLEHARFLQWMLYLAANLYECGRRIYHPAAYGGEAGAELVKLQAIRDFPEMIGPIAPTLQPYVLGKEISAADFYLYVVGGWLPEGRDPVHHRWPALAQHSSLLGERASVRKVEAQQP